MKHVPVASIGVSSNDPEITAGRNALMSDTGRNENDIARSNLYSLAVLAAESQSCRAMIHTKHFMGRAVVMSKGIDAVSPGIVPIVLSEPFFENRSAILGVRYDPSPIEEQRQNAARVDAVVLERELLRLNDLSFFSRRRDIHEYTAISRAQRTVVVCD